MKDVWDIVLTVHWIEDDCPSIYYVPVLSLPTEASSLLHLSLPLFLPPLPSLFFSPMYHAQLANIAGSPVFSNKERYPHFFRALPPEPGIHFSEGIFVNHFEWTEVAYIVQNEHLFAYVREINSTHTRTHTHTHAHTHTRTHACTHTICALLYDIL